MAYRKRKETTHILVHCSGTEHGVFRREVAMRALQRAALAKKLHSGVKGAISYNGVVDSEGVYFPGRPLDVRGTHGGKWNDFSLGLCLMGGLDKKGNPSFRFSDQQFETARIILAGWRERYNIPAHNVLGHRDTGANKHCPCFDVQPWYVYGELWRSSVEEQRQFEAGVISA